MRTDRVGFILHVCKPGWAKACIPPFVHYLLNYFIALTYSALLINHIPFVVFLPHKVRQNLNLPAPCVPYQTKPVTVIPIVENIGANCHCALSFEYPNLIASERRHSRNLAPT